MAAVAAAALVVACGGGGGKGSSGGGNGGSAGGAAQPVASVAANALLITRDQSLYLRDMKSGKESKLLTAPANQFITYPAWSSDGRRFVYMLDSPFQGNTNADWGSDMYVADANGANQKLILKHDQTGAELESPTWTPDGKAIIFSYFLTQYDAQGQYKGQVYQAQKLDLASGAVTPFLDDATGTELCSDGSKIAYVDFNQTDFTSFGVWVSDGDGKNGKLIAGSNGTLQAFASPVFSPDCKRIIFAAVGGALGQQQTGTTGTLLTRLIDAFRPQAADAHGPPWDLWTVNVDGTDLKRVTHVNEDLPYPAWSTDGQTVLFLGTGGLYQMSADGSNLKKIDQGTVHGQIAWHQK